MDMKILSTCLRCGISDLNPAVNNACPRCGAELYDDSVYVPSVASNLLDCGASDDSVAAAVVDADEIEREIFDALERGDYEKAQDAISRIKRIEEKKHRGYFAQLLLDYNLRNPEELLDKDYIKANVYVYLRSSERTRYGISEIVLRSESSAIFEKNLDKAICYATNIEDKLKYIEFKEKYLKLNVEAQKEILERQFAEIEAEVNSINAKERGSRLKLSLCESRLVPLKVSKSKYQVLAKIREKRQKCTEEVMKNVLFSLFYLYVGVLLSVMVFCWGDTVPLILSGTSFSIMENPVLLIFLLILCTAYVGVTLYYKRDLLYYYLAVCAIILVLDSILVGDTGDVFTLIEMLEPFY